MRSASLDELAHFRIDHCHFRVEAKRRSSRQFREGFVEAREDDRQRRVPPGYRAHDIDFRYSRLLQPLQRSFHLLPVVIAPYGRQNQAIGSCAQHLGQDEIVHFGTEAARRDTDDRRAGACREVVELLLPGERLPQAGIQVCRVRIAPQEDGADCAGRIIDTRAEARTVLVRHQEAIPARIAALPICSVVRKRHDLLLAGRQALWKSLQQVPCQSNAHERGRRTERGAEDLCSREATPVADRHLDKTPCHVTQREGKQAQRSERERRRRCLGMQPREYEDRLVPQVDAVGNQSYRHHPSQREKSADDRVDMREGYDHCGTYRGHQRIQAGKWRGSVKDEYGNEDEQQSNDRDRVACGDWQARSERTPNGGDRHQRTERQLPCSRRRKVEVPGDVRSRRPFAQAERDDGDYREYQSHRPQSPLPAQQDEKREDDVVLLLDPQAPRVQKRHFIDPNVEISALQEEIDVRHERRCRDEAL